MDAACSVCGVVLSQLGAGTGRLVTQPLRSKSLFERSMRVFFRSSASGAGEAPVASAGRFAAGCSRRTCALWGTGALPVALGEELGVAGACVLAACGAGPRSSRALVYARGCERSFRKRHWRGGTEARLAAPMCWPIGCVSRSGSTASRWQTGRRTGRGWAAVRRGRQPKQIITTLEGDS
jgi:hypothetical protein